MCEAPGSVVTLLCSDIQLYSAERRIADCILADVKRASMCTSAELARLSSSSEATITRLCHKLGFENYRKFQLALARDAMEQQETARRTREEGQDELRQALLDIQANREEETLAFAQTLTPKDLLMAFSTSGRDAGLEEVISAAKVRGAPVLLITCDSHSPLAHLSDYVMTASNREQRLIEGSHAASLLSPNILVEVLYYLLRMENL